MLRELKTLVHPRQIKKITVDKVTVEHEVVRSGAFHGSAETRAYVKRVMRRYNRFKFKIQVHSYDHH